MVRTDVICRDQDLNDDGEHYFKHIQFNLPNRAPSNFTQDATEFNKGKIVKMKFELEMKNSE